jgi:hypothetical protein
MFVGLEALLGPLVPYLIAALGALVGLGGIYLKGRAAGKDVERQAQRQARDETQARLDAARRQDAAVDRRTAEEIDRLRPSSPCPSNPHPPPGQERPGSTFTFGWLLAILLPLALTACATVGPVAPVAIDIPAAPLLADCPAAPHPAGRVEERAGQRVVVLAVEDAAKIREYLQTSAACWQAREFQLRGWGEKLANRLRAVGGQP